MEDETAQIENMNWGLHVFGITKLKSLIGGEIFAQNWMKIVQIIVLRHGINSFDNKHFVQDFCPPFLLSLNNRTIQCAFTKQESPQ